MDFPSVIWTRAHKGPLKMGDLLLTERETRFTYTEPFRQSGLPGMGLLASPAIFAEQAVVFRARPAFPIHPRLMAFIPGSNPKNIQRRLYGRILAKREFPPAAGWATEWEMALLAGKNGIGHLFLFRDDLEAQRWFEHPARAAQVLGTRSRLWKALSQDIAANQTAFDADDLARLLGPTPSAGGMIPKLLVAIPDRPHWDGRIAPAGTRTLGETPSVDVLLKVEPAEYQGVVALESLCLELHRELGFDVPRFWRRSQEGLNLLAIQRFDREDGQPVPVESFLSVFASGNQDLNGNDDTHMGELAGWLADLGAVANLAIRQTQAEVYRRFLMALLTGNGDMHLENLSFIGGETRTRLSPVYDPAPMRAWPRHNVRSAIPILFEAGKPPAKTILELGSDYGLSENEANDLAGYLLAATEGYLDRVASLSEVPAAQRDILARVVQGERRDLEKQLGKR